MRENPGWARVAGHALLTGAVALLFLAKPWPNDLRGRPWVRYVRLSPHLGYPFSIDSPEFLRVAQSPRALLEPRSPRQSRPLYPLAAAGVGHALQRVTGAPCPERSPACNPFLAAYAALNFLVLVGALGLFRRLLAAAAPWRLGVVMLSLGLLANEVVKVFFWTPHTQLLSVLAPLACVAAARHGLRHPVLARGPAVRLGLVSGTASLAYGTFLLMPFCFGAGAAIAGARAGRARTALRSMALVLVGVLAPLLAWYLVAVATAGSFYSDETERFRHVVWVADAASHGARVLGIRIAIALRQQIAATATATGHVLALFTLAVAGAALAGVRWRALDREARLTLAAAGVTLPLLFGFLTMLTRHPTRLAWSLVPPLLVATAVLLGAARQRLSPRLRRPLDALVCAWALGWLAWELWSGYPLVARA